MAKAIVIGGGFGGIAAALRLRKKGYDVTIIDKQDKLGGRAYQYERHTPHGTFIHDAGPTVITAKFLFDELFELFGKKREDYVEFRDIYPWYRIVFAGEVTKPGGFVGATPASPADAVRRADAVQPPAGDAGVAPTSLPFFDYGGTLEQFEAQIAKFEPKDVAGFRKFLAHSKKIFDVGFTQLGDQPFDKFTTMLKCAPQLLRLQNYKTVYGMASKYITNESLRRVFSFQPLLVGGNPFNTTSIYSLIFYLERQWGVQFAMGGTGAIVRGLQRLMREEGIEIRLGAEVSAINICYTDRETAKPRVVEQFSPADVREPSPAFIDSVTTFADNIGGEILSMTPAQRNRKYARVIDGIVLNDGETIPVDYNVYNKDVVVCNADAPFVYKQLIEEDKQSGLAPKRLESMKYSMGLFVLYFGTTKQYPNVAHHTIVLGHAYKELITKLFDTLELETEDLSVYLHRPTATDPSMAPAGCESFYCLVPVPNLQSGHDWAEWGPKVRDATVKYLEKTTLPGLSDCIVDDFYVTPKHFEQNLNTLHGTGFSIAPIFSQSAWFRFHNKAPGIEGLYFVGAGTHPGAGMPGVLCSAKVVDRLVPAVEPSNS